MKPLTGPLDSQYDVIVVGSGAAALTAALTSATAGQSVVILEKSSLLGGTSAVSGGMLWIPNNHLALEAGLSDSAEDAKRYTRAIARGRGVEELRTAAIDHGDDMLKFLINESDVQFSMLDDFPDYRQDLEGAALGGRTVEPQLFNSSHLGSMRDFIRTDGRLPFTMQEYEKWGAFTRFPWEQLQQRKAEGVTAKGHALISALISSCLEQGVDFVIEARVEQLLSTTGEDSTKIEGVKVAGQHLTATQGVVLASGGFEWDKELASGMLQSNLYAVCSPPSNEGDGLRMAQRIGAALGSMREAWWAPMSVIPGDLRDGQQIGTLLRFERQGPGSIMVNRHGQRFANESQNYNDLARALHSWDSAENTTLNTPAWVVFDHKYLEKYGLLTHRAGDPIPAYLQAADTLEELAQKISVPAEQLQDTVQRFNQHAAQGTDPDFHRGESSYDKYWGDAANPYPNPSLAPLETGPFYALAVVNGGFGTSGGVRTNQHGQVLDVDSQPIEGLFAAGNVAESAYASGYPGAGATLGPMMTMAYRIGMFMNASLLQKA